jgi:di/tricarboxylate transporter
VARIAGETTHRLGPAEVNADLIVVLALLASAVAMFAVNRPSSDVVGILMILALPFTGVIEIDEALAGFADPNIVLIALLFVLGESLVRTGIARRLGDWLVGQAGPDEGRLIALLMLVVGTIGSVMSSTGVVAIFIPVVLRIAASTRIAPGRLMMPLSVAALVSGMMTLVATAPNLVVQSQLLREGLPGFHFFSFTPLGLPILVLAIGYMLLARRWLANPADPEARHAAADGRARIAAWIDEYGIAAREHRLRVRSDSPLVGRTLAELKLPAREGASLLTIERRERSGWRVLGPSPNTRLEIGDVLFVHLADDVPDPSALAERFRLERLPLATSHFSDLTQDIGMAEVMLPAHSSLPGRPLLHARFRAEHDLAVIGVKRGRTAMAGSLSDIVLQVGDTLLVAGPWRAVRKLLSNPSDLVVISLPAELEEVHPASGRARPALAVLALVVALMASGIIPNVQAALLGCLLMGLIGAIDMRSAYRSIHWQSLVLIVGMLPFSLALQRAGGVDLAADALLELVGESSPRAVLASLFAVTAIVGLFVSNTATAVLMAPVALSLAAALGASPYPFAMTIALASSAAFMTPVSSPVNTLVVSPGSYRFMDFVRVGVPLTLLVGLVTVIAVPWWFPM